MSTIKVDTVRPVTTDASLTLQGDSSGSGVTGLVIDSTGTVTTGTLGSGVVFPAGHVIDVSFYQETTNSGNQSSDYGWGTVLNESLISGQKLLIHMSGGGLLANDGSEFGYAAIQYDTTTLTTSSQGNFAYGGQSYVRDTVAENDPRILVGQMVSYLYEALSDVTLYFRPALHVTTASSIWNSSSDRPINIITWKIS